MRLPILALAGLALAGALIGATAAPPASADADDRTTAEEPASTAEPRGAAPAGRGGREPGAGDGADGPPAREEIRDTYSARDVLLAIIAFGVRHSRK